ncbi:sensor domain-containing diguanylate cyclase [Proteinivorax tanatarense]|uniref:Sensor domain-containing diguanylate cyclase n=1 Tax=Proteinivorax tanatarense TaxID=1260629 RepID=A0AAU7VK62_9FIRM
MNSHYTAEYLKKAEELAEIGVWEFDHNKGTSQISNQVYNILGLKRQKFNDIFYLIKIYFASQKHGIIRKLLNKETTETKDCYKAIYKDNGKKMKLGIKFQYDIKKNVTFGIIQDLTLFKLKEEQLIKSLKIKDAMLEISHAIVEIENTEELFDFILSKITSAIDKTDLASVLLLDEKNNLKISASKGYKKEQVNDFEIKLQDAFIWQKTDGNIHETVIMNNLKEDLPTQYHTILDNNMGITPKSSMCGPVFVDNKLCGFINIECEENDIFDDVDWSLMEYVRKQLSIAISKRKLHEKTVYLSRYDELTGVYNRRYFEDLIKKRMESSALFSLVLFDLNRLKEVNDTYGHLAGDAVIKKFAYLLNSILESDDFVARFGGDEFIVFFSNRDKSEVIKKIKILKKRVQEPIDFEGNFLKIGFCYGISNYPEEALDYHKLVKISDANMYHSKRQLYDLKKEGEGRC